MDAEANADNVQFCTNLSQWLRDATAIDQGRNLDYSTHQPTTYRDMVAAADRIAAGNSAWSDLGDVARRLDTSHAADMQLLQDYCASRDLPVSK